MADDFSGRYGDLLTGSYDCVDRIVLNAFFPLGHNPGGFWVWWRRLHGGSDDELDNTQRKHLIAGEYLATHEVSAGVFLVLAAKAPARVWEA